MPTYQDPERNLISALCRCYVASKAGGIVPPPVIDIHPVSGRCNLNCRWCIGKVARKTLAPLPPLLSNGNSLLLALRKILDPRWYPLWPGEFHFCGSDSEPLLIGNAIVPAIHFLLQHRRIVELVTNGLLLDNNELMQVVSKISVLHISLDVTSNEDYLRFKLPEGSTLKNAYTTVLANLSKISDYRGQSKSNLRITVSFVAIPETFEINGWMKSLLDLSKAGANRVYVRDDLSGTYGRVANLHRVVDDMAKNFSDMKIEYHAPDVPYSKCDFVHCRGPRLWPALAADGAFYPCAHTANSDFMPFANLMLSDSLIDLYQKVFSPRRSLLRVEEIACNRECPPIIGSFNNPASAKIHLGKDFFV